MNSWKDALVLVLVTSALTSALLGGTWGMMLSKEYFVSITELNWCKANEYCNDNNGSLILLNSQDIWTAVCHALRLPNIHSRFGLYWTALRLNSSYQCHDNGTWSYDGWAKWVNWHNEPNNCPDEACVAVKCIGMRTKNCSDNFKAFCRKDVPTTTQSTYSSVATTCVKTTTQSAHTAVVMSDVKTTTQSTHSAVVTSDFKTTTQSTHSAVVTSDVRTTTQNTPTAVVTADVKTTTQSTHSAEVTSDVRTTTQSTPTPGAKAVVPPMSTNVVPTAYNNTLVGVSCEECCVKNNKSRQLSHEELKSVIKELKSQLAVNKSNLSSNRRKLISVYDSRPSSVAMGGVAIAIMIVIPGIIVIPDMVNLVRFLYGRQKKHLL